MDEELTRISQNPEMKLYKKIMTYGFGVGRNLRFGDLNNDGGVGFADLSVLLGDWGLVHSSADLNGSGQVNFVDLFILLSNWTA